MLRSACSAAASLQGFGILCGSLSGSIFHFWGPCARPSPNVAVFGKRYCDDRKSADACMPFLPVFLRMHTHLNTLVQQVQVQHIKPIIFVTKNNQQIVGPEDHRAACETIAGVDRMCTSSTTGYLFPKTATVHASALHHKPTSRQTLNQYKFHGSRHFWVFDLIRFDLIRFRAWYAP